MKDQVPIMDPYNLKDVNPKRRKILNFFVKALPLIGGGAFLYPLYKYANFQESDKFTAIIPLAKLNSSLTKYSKALIVKNDKDIQIFDVRCTHMGCLLNIDEKNKKFVCPCHNSEFDSNGKRLKGPAKRDLDILSFKIKDEILYIG